MKKRIRLQYRLILSYFAVIIIPLIALGTIAFYISLSIVREQTIQQDETQIHQISYNVDSVIAHMENTSLIAYSSTLLQDYITDEDYSNMELLGDSNIHNYLYSLKSADYDHYTYILKSYNSDITYCNNYDYVIQQDYNFSQVEWIKEMKKRNGGSIFVPTYIPNYYDHNTTPVFTVARQINDNYTLLPLGYIIINCNANILDNIIDNNTSYTYILDENYSLVYPMIDQNRINFYEISDNLIQAIDSQDYLVSKLTSEKTGFTYIKITPYSDISKNSNLIIKITLITLILTILLSFFLSLPLARGISMPLNNLIKNMNKTSSDNHFEVSEIKTNVAEIYDLNKRFNQMMARINTYIESEYKSTIKKKDTEFKLLQSQISPHFLFNTLESIRMMAALNDDEETAIMIYNLANLYRYSIRITSTLVPLKSEIEHIYHYIMLQQMRFGDKFTYETDIDETALTMLVPQLILQPLIENCLTHGFGSIDSGGVIKLSCQRKGNSLLIIICDNGVGMSALRLDEIRQRLGHSESEGHIGILATYERIKHHFQDSSIHIDSKENEGTKISITLTYTETHYS